jgi:hypothetical protein
MVVNASDDIDRQFAGYVNSQAISNVFMTSESFAISELTLELMWGRVTVRRAAVPGNTMKQISSFPATPPNKALISFREYSPTLGPPPKSPKMKPVREPVLARIANPKSPKATPDARKPPSAA